MAATISFTLPLSGELARFKLPAGVQRRLRQLLDAQDAGAVLSTAERLEAEGLVEMAELLSLLKLRASHPAKRTAA
jgi:ABC-type transporter Mla MlaB component